MSDPIKKKKKAIIKNYLLRGIDPKNFKKFDIRNDTIIQGKSINQSLAFKKESFNRRNAALSLNETTSARSSGSYANPKEQRVTKNTSTGKYKVSGVYDKEELKNTMTPLKQQKLSPAAAKAKAIRDLKAANSPDRKEKRADSQKKRREAAKKHGPNWLNGKHYDHNTGRFTSATHNLGGTQNENLKDGTKAEKAQSKK